MIYNRIDAKVYKENFSKKFRNFGDKAPIMLSYVTDDNGVTIVHENTGVSYFYEWDFSIDVKSMIHKIKQDLSMNHYPRISRLTTITRNLAPEEQADLIAKGTSVDNVPVTITEEVVETYRIDRILALEDKFILVNEATGEQFNYKMNSSGIFFLKNYRSGVYKDLFEAGDAFFKKSTLVEKLNKKIS